MPPPAIDRPALMEFDSRLAVPSGDRVCSRFSGGHSRQDLQRRKPGDGSGGPPLACKR